MMSSLNARLLVAVSLVLAVFFGVTVLVLDNVFRNAAESAVEDRLDVQIFLLLAEAEPNPMATLDLPEDLPEPRFSSAASGLYGQINSADGTSIWRSQSAVGTELPMTPGGELGVAEFRRTTLADGRPIFLHTLNVEWEFEDGSVAGYQFGVAESLQPFVERMKRYRRQLFGWFAGLAVALVITLGLLLRWVLTPLRQIEREISAVEKGERPQLSEGYPRELQGLTRNTNRLIHVERKRLKRYRDTLGNLAHSLKTPLAVIRSSVDQSRPQHQEIENQLTRMDEIIGYQLNRAATSGAITLGNKPVEVSAVVGSIVRSLDKVYADKAPKIESHIPANCEFYGDQGDLTEILGNLLDNAYKYCSEHVKIDATVVSSPTRSRSGMTLSVEDDGGGIDKDDADRVFSRGVRIDEQSDGQGIGLAVVRDIVELCGGSLSISTSALGGARIVVSFPPV
ncbi:MAG: GHKL domain-containing protein [Gammaproteobacteria bacterium]|nr:GHKL domain-containing protein [Gammaproteobacteria bacterium]